jgi:ATP-dependent Clp protease ATP-binding subunit ClpA
MTAQSKYIGTEHLLLGLLAVEDSVAAKALTNLNVRADKVRQAVVEHIGTGTGPFNGEIRLTPRARKVTALAAEEARQLNHHYVGSEHLLLGLVREGEGVAAGILDLLGVDLDKARAEVTEVLGSQAKGNVITCRIWPRDLAAIDLLIEAGIRSTRSDAAAWLIHAGIEANRELFERVHATVAEIRRLRQQVQAVARDMEAAELAARRARGAARATSAAEETPKG